jgi:hypothetical protein
MSANKLRYLLHLRVLFSFLQVIRGSDYPGKYISQSTRIIGSPLYLKCANETSTDFVKN